MLRFNNDFLWHGYIKRLSILTSQIPIWLISGFSAHICMGQTQDTITCARLRVCVYVCYFYTSSHIYANKMETDLHEMGVWLAKYTVPGTGQGLVC